MCTPVGGLCDAPVVALSELCGFKNKVHEVGRGLCGEKQSGQVGERKQRLNIIKIHCISIRRALHHSLKDVL